MGQGAAVGELLLLCESLSRRVFANLMLVWRGVREWGVPVGMGRLAACRGGTGTNAGCSLPHPKRGARGNQSGSKPRVCCV